MTILLLLLLIVYLALVSAPTSIRFIGMVLTRNSFGGRPLLWGSTDVRLGRSKAALVLQHLNGHKATAAIARNPKIRPSRERNHD
jgi:hypothetical protein